MIVVILCVCVYALLALPLNTPICISCSARTAGVLHKSNIFGALCSWINFITQRKTISGGSLRKTPFEKNRYWSAVPVESSVYIWRDWQESYVGANRVNCLVMVQVGAELS